MQITVLDGYTLNPGDLSWDSLRELGQLTVYGRTPLSEIYPRGRNAEILFTNKTPLSRETIEKLPKLRYIGVLATGFNVVDIAAAREKGITVTNIPAYGTDAVAQMTFALILELCHHAGSHSEAVRGGEWSRALDFCFWNYPLTELNGKTLGIIGLGRIGKRVAEIAAVFGMKIIAGGGRGREEIANVRRASLDEIFRISDIVSLHCPLTPETNGIINKSRLSEMKSPAFLINTSRGGLIIDDDLADALNRGVIAGAALDVLSVEPPNESNPLITAKNCLITPHIAWAAREARARLMETAAGNLKAFLGGKPQNTVN
jgi:glycerate dehydrogenase